MGFTEAHENYMKEHLAVREGERARRLLEGHGYAEKWFLETVWWPAFGHFQHLHPEYEVSDFKDGYRFLDFAYIRDPLKLAIEIDGYGPHWRNVSRIQFSDHCRRQNDLMIDGWKVLRFSFDDVKESPRYCQQKIQQLLGRWLGEENAAAEADWLEKEVIRLFLRSGGPLTPGEVRQRMGIGEKKTRAVLYDLARKKWILPHSGNERIRSYRLSSAGRDLTL
ncbi:hypothetical protein J25TS5_35590 [Paenibacillus faecis]|uniref:DNA-binding response regulator n=1 Tax=Paenibacillus faecis TaxID=862114 RepID=UPI001B2AD79E|nr:DNA-binding response regulator [Paenibacillus faecis]GIO86627.1 hypothetical protein J25TS5_35590 [Paenibacillus faecis]